MGNTAGRAYGLTVLCPLRDDRRAPHYFAAVLLERLSAIPLDEDSPMAQVPNTYLCRFFVLDEVPYQGNPAYNEHLQSKYLVFVCELHGTLEPYLRGMWENAREMIKKVFEFCIGFEDIKTADEFVYYIKRCQVKTTFYFNGSTDAPLEEQLKTLYLKQEFAKFVRENQGRTALEVQQAFSAFVERTQPSNLAAPTWRPGASSLEAL
ncbi:MAG: hypothetical protein ABW133_06885 [Polyangiaceae bacterium]